MALALLAWPLFSQTGQGAVLLRLEGETQQVRVEAFEAGTARWMAIASGYRDATDSGWLRIALPAGYESSQLRVMASWAPSPFAGKLQGAFGPVDQFLDYPPCGMAPGYRPIPLP